jgi:hypothetical protein
MQLDDGLHFFLRAGDDTTVVTARYEAVAEASPSPSKGGERDAVVWAIASFLAMTEETLHPAALEPSLRGTKQSPVKPYTLVVWAIASFLAMTTVITVNSIACVYRTV